MKEFTVKFANTNDIVIFTKIADEFEENIDVRSHDNHYVVDAKSIMGLFSLDLSKPVIVYTEDDKVARKFKERVKKYVVY